MSAPRTPQQRRADTEVMLRSPARDVWVASAAPDDDGGAVPYLVPLTMAWVAGRVVLALAASSRTARNIGATSTTRLSLGGTRDVVMVDAVLEARHAVVDAPEEVRAGYAGQADWDPRDDPDGYVYLVLRPQRIQAWRNVGEIAGRTLMRDGIWVV